MKLVNHGGCCCGIKTIYGFPWAPSEMILEAGKLTRFGYSPATEDAYPGKNFWSGGAPREKALERLARLIAYVEKQRPSHIIEIVLSGYQMSNWKEEVEKQGFICANPGGTGNSNTGYRIYVFHRHHEAGKLVK